MKLKERELIFKKNGISIINNSFDKFLISIGKNNVSESKKKYLHDNNKFRKKSKCINPNKYIFLKYNNKDKPNKLKLFSKSFMNLNIKRCKIIIRNKKSELKEYLDLKDISIEDETIKITIKLYDFLIMSNTFYDCSSLISISDISMIYTTVESDLSYMFYNCASLKNLPDISKWNTSKIIDMKYMFYNCKSLTNLPNLKKWDLKKVSNIEGMFGKCSKLVFMPDISNWNTSNVNNMSYIFYDCSSLHFSSTSLNWNTSNVSDMSYIFYNCSSLENIPDISNWDTKNVTDIKYMFYNCSNLEYLPDISNWNIKNVNNMNNMYIKHLIFWLEKVLVL